MHNELFADFPADDSVPVKAKSPHKRGKPRLRYAQRQQGEIRFATLDDLLPPDHLARLVWDFVLGLDISPLLEDIQAVEGNAGRDSNDPRILLALWLLATIDGIGSARELDRLCQEHLAYQWLCGGVSMNYHTLSAFRTKHVTFLDGLLTDSVASLLHQELIELKQVAQDGMRVRASAGSSSFRREPTLQKCREQAQTQVEALRQQLDDDNQAVTRRQQAARERAARERLERLEKALAEREALQELREQQKQEKGTKYDPDKLRASSTDPEARKMKMADGGTRPAYNFQFATTTQGIVVGVDVTNSGSDAGQLLPMVQQIKKRFGRVPDEALVDGGFVDLDDIEQVHQLGVQVYAPVKNAEKKKAEGVDPYQPRPKDGVGVGLWRQRMGTAEAAELYLLRSATAEWTNAQARNRGLQQVRVRGQQKVLAIALWYALAHNLIRAWRLRSEAEAASR